MKITVAGKTFELTDCQNLDYRHCNLRGHPYCRIKGYVKAEKTEKRPEGCRCSRFVLALPEKELAIRKIDLAYGFTARASQKLSTNEIAAARMETRNACIAIESALELIEKMEMEGYAK